MEAKIGNMTGDIRIWQDSQKETVVKESGSSVR
jgi:hypothetical protein